MSKLPIIVLDFSGVYDHEAFASHHDIIHVDCQDMKGVDCYCDEESRKELHRRLSPYPPKAVHFLDSGDYHYLTEYWVSQSKTKLKAIYMKRFFISMIGFLACMKLMAQSPVSFILRRMHKTSALIHVRQLHAIKDAEVIGKYSDASWVLNW